MISVSGYRTFDEISVSSRSIVFRGRRIEDDLPVIVKVLKGDYPTVREVVRYKQEYQITRNLEHVAGVVRVHELLTHGNSLAMILEDFGGYPSIGLSVTSRSRYEHSSMSLYRWRNSSERFIPPISFTRMSTHPTWCATRTAEN